ncbi:MCE-family protein [Mycobacterium sp. EPa45]|nr:MCE family protein [Mycobacterium sp. EPa45]AKK29531.1 MCE-family protein [Mycobacterium sp. EPa45]
MTHLGPGPADRSETESSATPVAAKPGQSFGARGFVRPLAGLFTVLVVCLIVVLAVSLFRDSFTPAIRVTVLSPRAGLVMNPDAKVKMQGIQVGKVDSIESLTDGQAAIHLAMNPADLQFIPANVLVDVTSSTVFGAKFVDLVPPAEPSNERLTSGQVLEGQRVTVEINTVFQQLTWLLAAIDPVKLNEVLGALSKAMSGRGERFGQALTDLDTFLAKLDPSLPTLSHELETLPAVAAAYADAAPELIRATENSVRISQTIVDQQNNLDALLLSTIGLADLGNEVVSDNSQSLANVLHLFAPVTDLTSEYHESLNCALGGMQVFLNVPDLPVPGVAVSIGLELGLERYRYPANLPKIGAGGPPNCKAVGLPKVPAGMRPPYVVTDQGANPAQYGNQGLVLNSDGLKQALFGPLDGPPRNSPQVGQPG